MNIRNARPEDLDAIHHVESVCFSPNEAASYNAIAQRLHYFPHHFWLLEAHGKLIGFINGMVTNHETIIDVMFQQADLHDEQGDWQAVFGLAVLPDHRRQGHAETLVRHLTLMAGQQNRTGITLTCKDYLIPYYEKLGFRNAGRSGSVHGGEVWYDMQLFL